MTTHSSILAWRIHGQRSLAGCCPWGHKESDTTGHRQGRLQGVAHLSFHNPESHGISVHTWRESTWKTQIQQQPSDAHTASTSPIFGRTSSLI